MELEKLKLKVQETMERFDAPSYSAAVFHAGTVHTFAGGLSNKEAAIAPNADTLYAIGSCTKSFVAGAMCTLVDQGLVALDDPVRKYIPEFSMYDSYVTEHLTIRDMLCHRCGLFRYDQAWYFGPTKLTEADLVSMFQWMKPTAPFRYKLQYNNFMFALAGVLLQHVTGKSWEEVVRENIFEPLGIERAAFSPAEANAMGNVAVPYEHRNKSAKPVAVPYYEMGVIGPAGGLYMAPRELLKWDIALLKDGEYEGRRILSPEMAREIVTPQMIRGADMDCCKPITNVINNQTYGLGFMLEVFKGHRLVHHGGSIDGFIADQSFMPDDDFAFVALTNLGLIKSAAVMRYTAAENQLGGSEDWPLICCEAMKKATADAKAACADVWATQPKNMPCPVALSDICGTYTNELYGKITITAQGQQLCVTLDGTPIIGTHYADRFFYLEEPNSLPDMLMEASVDIDVHGKVIGFSAALEPEVDASVQIYFVRSGE